MTTVRTRQEEDKVVTGNIFPLHISDKIVSEEILIIFQWIGYSLLCQFIDVVGTITNVINIICFLKLGFKDTINVSLLALSVSDLFCVATLIWTNICMNPAFIESDLPFDPIYLQYLISGWPHVIFARVTSCITAFITLERCLCVTVPLKVKSIFTSNRVAIIIMCLYIVLLASMIPFFMVNQLGLVFFPAKNKTLLALVVTENREQVEQVSIAFNNTFIPFSAFTIIIFCTIILTVKLRNQTKWRDNTITATQSDTVSSRDQRVIKMVVIISTLFIVCFTPISIIAIAMSVIPGLAIDGKYRNISMMFGGIALILESTNSAGNIFIYYIMSSKYKQAFNQMFNIKNREKTESYSNMNHPNH